MSRKKKDAGGREPGPPGWIPFALFLFAFVLRLLFWQASPDRSWAYSAAYQGDALNWLEYATAIKGDLPFAQNLPLRPPGNGYLVAALWDGRTSGLPWLKLAWCLMGALSVPFVYKAVRDSFTFPVALATGVLCAAASPLLMISTSINSEAPYLLLVAILLANWRGASLSPSPARLVGWGFTNALACLFRAEHLLFFVLATAALIAMSWRRDRVGTTPKTMAKRLAYVLGAAFFCLLPWHVWAWSASRDFNRKEPAMEPGARQMMAGLERQLSFLVWDEEAKAQAAALPAFSKLTATTFVSATVAYRGGREVKGADFAILDEAFGYRPQPISEHPLIALYGGLNFFLANPGDGEGGFSRVALERRPPLAGGAERYPPMLVGGLPPNDLAFTYPPHLQAVNQGYRLGFAWIAGHPGEAAGLLLKKAAIFWSGAAPGVGGFNLPLGLSGLRRRVDLTVATGVFAAVWKGAVFALFAYGVWVSRRRTEVLPFAALFLTQAVAALAFFGYARLGALTLPAVIAFAAAGAAAIPWPLTAPTQRKLVRAALGVGLVLLVTEVLRTVDSPLPYLDGQNTAQGDPFDPNVHENRRLELR